MLDNLIKFIFKTFVGIFGILLSPLFNILTSLFPQFPDLVYYIYTFLTTALTYISPILDLLFIPRAVFQIWFAYITIKITILISVKLVKFIIKIYNALKP